MVQQVIAGVATGPRPKIDHPAVRKLVLDVLVSEVMKWAWDSNQEQEMRKDLNAVLNRGHEDGFKSARYLEQHCHWVGCDMALVKILDEIDTYLFMAIQTLTKAWVQLSGVTPKYSEGQVVTHKGNQATITDVKHETAEYVLNIPALGHVHPGTVGITGTFVPWEDIDA